MRGGSASWCVLATRCFGATPPRTIVRFRRSCHNRGHDRRPGPAQGATDPLPRRSRGILGRHAWQEAFDRLSEADRAGSLSGADLEALAETAFFTAHADFGIDVKERAFKARLAEGDKVRAAYLAFDIGREYEYTGKPSIASGWVRRGEGLLDGEPETYAHGYLAFYRSDHARASGDMAAALAFAEEAVEIGKRTANADLQAFARSSLGSIKIAGGSTIEGFNLMEEASLAAVNGELSPIAAGVACCSMISACRDLTDYGRAGEWLEATEKYCERQSVGAFPGVCRVHRAELKAMSGAWENAEAELRQATTELAAYNAVPPMADGIYAMADIRRLRGDLEGAEAALREAHGYGRSPQPALALIRLAEGKVKAASSGINAAVADQGADVWARARLRPAQVEIAIAANDLALAREAAEDLARHVATYPLPALEAASHQALGRVLLAEGDASSAAAEFRSSIKSWRIVSNPHEIARTRALLAKALRGLDDDDAAELELRAARDEFERLGARPDLAAAEASISAAAAQAGVISQVRMTFMFTDIVGFDEPGRGDGRPGMGARAEVARRHAPAALREGWRRGREPDR